MIAINEAWWDRAARVVLGLVALAAVLTDQLAGWVMIAGAVVGTLLLVTGLIGWCPLYSLLGIRTNRPRSGHAAPS